jgi:hypothetical protein
MATFSSDLSATNSQTSAQGRGFTLAAGGPGRTIPIHGPGKPRERQVAPSGMTTPVVSMAPAIVFLKWTIVDGGRMRINHSLEHKLNVKYKKIGNNSRYILTPYERSV